MSESDEIGQEIERAMRMALMAGGQAAEGRARRIADRQREAATSSREEASATERAVAAERDGARVIHRQAGDQRWWEVATPEDVGRVWEAAQTWAGSDPQAAAAADLVRAGVSRKWGIDVDTITGPEREDGTSARAQADDVAAALADSRSSRGDAQTREQTERARAEQDRDEARSLEDTGAQQDREVAEGAGADERDLAGARRDEAGVHEENAERAQETTATTSEGTSRPYARARAEEMPKEAPDAAAARLESSPGFPVPARQAVAQGTGNARARVVRGTAPSTGRGSERGR